MAEPRAPALHRALQGVLYGGAPFFVWPWKTTLHALVGSDYATAYRHFRRDHSNTGNLVAHLLCLVWQLGSNFALLEAVDRWLAAESAGASGAAKDTGARPARARLFATASALSWAFTLARASSPAPVKFASLGLSSPGSTWAFGGPVRRISVQPRDG